MKTAKLNGNGKIIAGTEIGNIFTYPLVGPGKYQEVMNHVSRHRLLRPTTNHIFSLINLALQNPDDRPCRDILSRFRNPYFWSCTENLWGEKDVIVYDNVDGKMPSNRTSLLERLKEGDKGVRIARYGFKTGRQSVSELVRNPYIIAQVGDKDFAEDVVAGVAERLSKFLPWLYALRKKNRDFDLRTYTTIYSAWGNDGLSIDACCDDANEGGYAFGIMSRNLLNA